MKQGPAWLILGAVSVTMAVAGYQIGALHRIAEAPATATTSAKGVIQGLVLTDIKGQAQGIDQWRGKVLVLNYWATWCHPCREEMPGFSRLQDKYRDKGVQFVGISIDTAEKIIEFQKETPVNYPLLIGDMAIMRSSAEFGNDRQALPFTAVLNRDGRLAMTRLGRWTESDLELKLLGLISP